MDENAKTNEFKEMVKAALGELSNEEIEKLKNLRKQAATFRNIMETAKN